MTESAAGGAAHRMAAAVTRILTYAAAIFNAERHYKFWIAAYSSASSSLNSCSIKVL